MTFKIKVPGCFDCIFYDVFQAPFDHGVVVLAKCYLCDMKNIDVFKIDYIRAKKDHNFKPEDCPLIKENVEVSIKKRDDKTEINNCKSKEEIEHSIWILDTL